MVVDVRTSAVPGRGYPPPGGSGRADSAGYTTSSPGWRREQLAQLLAAAGPPATTGAGPAAAPGAPPAAAPPPAAALPPTAPVPGPRPDFPGGVPAGGTPTAPFELARAAGTPTLPYEPANGPIGSIGGPLNGPIGSIGGPQNGPIGSLGGPQNGPLPVPPPPGAQGQPPAPQGVVDLPALGQPPAPQGIPLPLGPARPRPGASAAAIEHGAQQAEQAG